MKNCKRISTILSGRCLSFFAVSVLALAMIIPTAVMSATLVDLGTAGDYVILAKTGISTTTGSAITGDLGISPAAASYITGFDLVYPGDDGTYATSSLVTGKVYASDYTSPTPSNLTTAVSNMEAAYTDANSRAVDFTNLHAGNISGQTLVPGVYKYDGDLLINSPGVTLDAGGDAAAVWIFQVAGNITMGSGYNVTLTNNALPGNIFWALAGEMEIGTNSHFEGIVLSQTAIHFRTDATFTGRALAQSAVTLQSNTITEAGTEPFVPIELASFTAMLKKGTVELTWQTETETENAYFLIYRNDEVIASIEGAGTTTEPHSYMLTDNRVIPGETYSYVLADVTIGNKEVKHSDMAISITVDEGNVARDFSIGASYPNPFNPTCVIPLNLAVSADVEALLYDVNGHMISKLHNGALTAGSHDLKIDGANLATGIYLVKIQVNDALHVQKIALMK